MDAFKPLITKYIFAYESNYIIKSISGLLENCNKQIVENSKQIVKNSNNKQIENIETNNNLDLEKEKIIIPGYMDHNPKTEALKKRNQLFSVKSITTDGL